MYRVDNYLGKPNPAVTLRLKALLFAIMCIGCCAMFIFIIWDEYSDLVELVTYGEYTTGEIVEYRFHQQRGRKGRIRNIYDHKITYDTNFRWFNLGQQFPLGTQFNVLYSVRNPQVAYITTADRSLMALAQDKIGWFGIIFLPCAALICGFSSFCWLKQIISPSEDEPNT